MDYVLAIVMVSLVAGLSYNTYRNIKRDGIGKILWSQTVQIISC